MSCEDTVSISKTDGHSINNVFLPLLAFTEAVACVKVNCMYGQNEKPCQYQWIDLRTEKFAVLEETNKKQFLSES